MMKQTAFILLALALLNMKAAHAADEHEAHGKPQTVDYALILPANLPHMLRTAMENANTLGLDSGQREVIRELIASAPLKVYSRLTQAEKLEVAIAREVLTQGQTLAEVQNRLDELVALKRGATEAQIATINRLQALMSLNQFRKLLKLSGIPDSQ